MVKLIDDKNFKLVTDLSQDEVHLRSLRNEVISTIVKCEEKKVGLGQLDYPPLSRQEITANLNRRREQKLLRSTSVPDMTTNEDGFQSLLP